MPESPTDRLLRRTRRRLFATTLGLLILLVVGVGAATAVVALRALDADVDRALEVAVEAQARATGSALPGAGDAAAGGAAEGGGEHEDDDEVPTVASTALLVLDATGRVVANPGGVSLAGIPDAGATASAAASGRDLRTVASPDGDVRVLTLALLAGDEDEGGPVAGFVQGAYSLQLHDAQSRSLVLAVVVVGLAGILAAAGITLLVTDRALVPVREGFEAQRRFVADASHELRTPAALVRANAEVLEREGLVHDAGRDLLADIIGEADRIGGLVGDLLQLATWDETSLVLTRTRLDVAEVAATTVRGAGALAAERQVRLELSADGPAPLDADRSRLVQLLLVLVDNAVDHSPEGSTVTVRVRRRDGDVMIDVDDEGPGIPPEDRERIFEPFTRLPGTTRHGSGGTGLGLAIARRIVAAHGGRIEATEPPAGGARFSVTLPAAG